MGTAQRELTQHYPHPGWVEHDPEELWEGTLAVCREVLATVAAERVVAIGLTNQRETTVLWDRETGAPIHNAIVWQDRRSATLCRQWAERGLAAMAIERTGLLLDPYFSASKIAWLLAEVPGARQAAEAGRLAFGTIDSFLLWRLTGGAVHATDATNAARTLLYNIDRHEWDPALLAAFGIPEALLPEVVDSVGEVGQSVPHLFGRSLPITGMAGDQQAAAAGQACFRPGMAKSTYGTGCFALMNTGGSRVRSAHRLLSTIAAGQPGHPSYALEGSLFVAGSAVQWLRDKLGIVASAGETADLAARARPQPELYLVPAFVGLGAPHWDPDARGAILGLTPDTGVPELVRATLEAMAFQTRDLVDAMAADAGVPLTTLRVDGGMAANDWMLQAMSDLLGIIVERPKVIETTAVGAAYLAGLALGLYPEPERMVDRWALGARFEPRMSADERDSRYAGWRQAVGRVLTTRPTRG